MTDSPGPAATAARISPTQLRALRARAQQAGRIGSRPAGGPAPASQQQQSLWFLDQFIGPGNATYNVNTVLELDGPLDIVTLEAALQGVIARHEVLRTTFDIVDDELVQIVHSRQPVLQLVSEPDESAVEGLVEQAAVAAFDLGFGPLMRAILFETGSLRHVLLLAFHHIIFDGWSLGVLFSELSAGYAGSPGELQLPGPALQYGDYAAWQRSMLAERAPGEIAYWRGRLAGAPPVLNLPTDRPRAAKASFHGAELHVRMPDGLASRLRARSREHRVTLFMLLLAAYQVVLSAWSGQEDVCVGAVVSGRTRPELESLIGYFVNVLVMRGDLSGDPEFATVLSRTRATVLDALEHQDVPFARLVAELSPRRSLGHNPLFQVMFVWQELADGELQLPGLGVRVAEARGNSSKCDLTLVMWEDADGLTAAFEYATDIFDGHTVNGFAADLASLLTAVADDPRQRLSELPARPRPTLHS